MIRAETSAPAYPAGADPYDPLADLDGPSVSELEQLEREQPAIIAELQLVTAELLHLRRPSTRTERAVRRARRVAAAARDAVTPAVDLVAAAVLRGGGPRGA